MPKVNDMIPSKYFRLADFDGGREERLTITSCRLEEMGDGESKWCLSFEESSQGLVLNKTNILMLGELFGDDSDNWPGNLIALAAGRAKTPSGSVPALLVKEPRAKQKPKPATTGSRKPATPMTQAEADAPDENQAAADDDIPF